MPDRTSPADACNAPLMSVIACGQVLGASPDARTLPPMPCYQALGPWGEPDAGLPWFRIGLADVARAAGDPAQPSAAGATTLAAILQRRGGLLLVVGNDHDSLALALAIATYARGRGHPVTALLAGHPGLPPVQRAALQRCTDAVRDCPQGMDPLLAARTLSSGVAGPGQRISATPPDPAVAGLRQTTPDHGCPAPAALAPRRPGQN